MSSIKVIKPGLATYVEDNGRYGYYHLGVPPGGALDQLSYKIGNLLLGNDENLAALEMSLLGAELQFVGDAYIAVTGADMTPIINGERRPSYTVLGVKDGDILTFDYLKSGSRTYLCVAGGIDVPVVMGSRSTYPWGGIGGYKGRKLEEGDELPVGSFRKIPTVGRKASDEYKVSLKEVESLRVITGLQDYKLEDESVDYLFSTVFVVSSLADRAGFRFKNSKPLKYKNLPQPFGAGSNPSNITDACYPLGSMQAPGGNDLIVLQRDAPSGGGYAMYFTVISCDMDRMSQFPPNHKVQFKRVSMDEAIEARRRYNALVDKVRSELWISY